MSLPLVALLLLASAAQAGLQRCSDLVIADTPASPRLPRGGLRIACLGVNGYQFETGTHTLLIGPYFTRASLWRIATKQTGDACWPSRRDRPTKRILGQTQNINVADSSVTLH